jgi:glycolate oxidase FAD binding subunit
MERDSLAIDGVGPMPVVRPASADELGEIVRRAAAEKQSIYPVGGGTALDYGLPPARPGVAVELRSLDKVIDFPARDMTITVETGITMARLREITQAEKLHLPIDVPDPEHATLGGAIARNVSGPRRFGYGTFRDYILGITTVNDRGEQVSAGGRVVKNVAGYDLMKLHTGALGTLGVITRVTLKLKPVPEDIGAVLVGVPSERLAEALDIIHRSQTRPSWIMSDGIPAPQGWVRNEPELRFHWPTRIGFDGTQETIAWQLEHLKHELGKDGWYSCGSEVGRNGLTELPEIPNRISADSICRLRASIRPSRVAQFCCLASSLAENVFVIAFPGNGVVKVELGSDDWPMARVREALERLLAEAGSHDGNVIIERCPPEWKKSLPVWGRPPANILLQKAVKRALDPQNLFNPGRFVTDAF